MFGKLSQGVIDFFKQHNVNPEDVYNQEDVNVLRLYSVYDVVSGVFDSPFTAKTDGGAVRLFENFCLRSDLVKRHPEDYQLFHVGYFSQQTGYVINETNSLVSRAISFTPKNPSSVELPSSSN